jgi:hypothetical protein
MNDRLALNMLQSAAPAWSLLVRELCIAPYIIRYFLPFIALSLLLSASLGCHKKISVPISNPQQTSASPPVESAPQAITPTVIPPVKPEPVEPSPAPIAVAAPSSLDMGSTSFRAGDYIKAARSFEDYLKTDSKSENRDIALFYLGLSRALSNNANRNMRRAEDALKRLIVEFPTSQYKGPAEFILGLQAQIENLQSDLKEKELKIKQLSEELQKLKEIDMQRRPSRPLD